MIYTEKSTQYTDDNSLINYDKSLKNDYRQNQF